MLNNDLRMLKNEVEKEEQRGTIETSKGEVSYSTSTKKADLKKKRPEESAKNEEERSKGKIRKLIVEEAATRAAAKRPQAYDNVEDEEIDKEPPRRRF